MRIGLPLTSKWGLLVLFAHKPDGNLCFCIDYHMLNNSTVCNRFTLPRHEDLFNRLGSACYFSSLELMSGKWLVHIADSDVHKTTF